MVKKQKHLNRLVGSASRGTAVLSHFGRRPLWLSLKASLSGIALIVCTCSLPSGAQVDTGSILGYVSDASGGRIVGANVIVREENTGIANRVVTSKDGSYTISPLKLGIYTLTVEKDRFKTSVQEHIEVTI